MDVLVTYDIETTTKRGQRRLTRVAKICESYGTRVQDSVFECRVSDTRHARLLVELDEAIDKSKDCVHLYRFDGDLAKARTSIGKSPPRNPGQHWLI